VTWAFERRISRRNRSSGSCNASVDVNRRAARWWTRSMGSAFASPHITERSGSFGGDVDVGDVRSLNP